MVSLPPPSRVSSHPCFEDQCKMYLVARTCHQESPYKPTSCPARKNVCTAVSMFPMTPVIGQLLSKIQKMTKTSTHLVHKQMSPSAPSIECSSALFGALPGKSQTMMMASPALQILYPQCVLQAPRSGLDLEEMSAHAQNKKL